MLKTDHKSKGNFYFYLVVFAIQKKKKSKTRPVWVGWLGVVLWRKRLTICFLVRAHAWVEGLVPCLRHM